MGDLLMGVGVVEFPRDGGEPKQLINGRWLPVYRDDDGYYHIIDERVERDGRRP